MSVLYELDRLVSMADPEDRALGAVIRRRRTARGLQQQEMAERLGLAAVVYGRMELGNRPIRATELRDIAKALGASADDLLREVTPVTPEEQVERAVARRDTAYTGLREYGAAVVDAIEAVTAGEYGALVDDHQIDTAEELSEYLGSSQPVFDGLTVPAELVPVLRQVLTDLAEAVSIYTAKKEETSDG